MMRYSAILLVFISSNLFSDSALKADPDNTTSGYEYSGTALIKVGDYVNFRFLSAGGFVEIRNEKRFNQKLLPNHNWRGYVFAYGHYNTTDQPDKSVGFSVGFEHESAHPTMGIKEAPSTVFDMIYDDRYRTMVLNSLVCRYSRYSLFDQNLVRFSFDYQFYFQSKNTPELSGDELANGNGLSGGIEYYRIFTSLLSVYASVFDRYIFKGKKKATGTIYMNDTAGGFQNITVSQPVINDMNTISFKTGLVFSLKKISREIELYYTMLYGNIFGFVDSREDRWKIGGGISIAR